MEPKDYALAISVFVTFLLGIWNVFSNQRNTFINTVTNQRIKWIEQLRQDISTFSGLTYTWCISCMEGKPQEYEMLKEIDRLRYVIRLRLNPEGEHDKTIEKLIIEIPELTESGKQAQLKAKLEDLVQVSRLLLKQEWERVKLESNPRNPLFAPIVAALQICKCKIKQLIPKLPKWP
jgi:hypothetical protein